MRINDDLSRPVIAHASQEDWIPSPAPGVDRRMLFRIGEEKARATSIVRYAPGSAFARHVHNGGEEFLVLEGVFQDDEGDYPTGTYVRNPPGTSHAPASQGGCTIFVRLWQFRADDRAQTVRLPGEGQPAEPRPGASAATVLFDDGHETVLLEDWRATATVTVENSGGLEFLLVSGGLTVDGEAMSPQDWGRLPAGVNLHAQVGAEGARVWIKRGPLLHPDVCEF
ncbi:quercetin dioxygenase-like cupin family protein [Bradyrhizobium sp. CIR18]|uniref:cupin domain-containing protein n=1 Tax=Bradyrhizobium sp. CIR18 TaxID=2663839 RepID=UPI001606A2E0|nr:cupin domain-containing protein [Bradyrhizobium sp. CIR18]MBB4361714.1 quercetin dioxygenase-like cupin family protein [Bradyrhizobium sp. CIR18]